MTFLLMSEIDKEKRSKYLMEANIAMLPHISDQKVRDGFFNSLRGEDNFKPLEIESDTEEIEKFKKELGMN